MLLLQAPLDSIRGLQASNDLLVLDRLEDDLPTVRRKPVAVSIAIGMLLLPTLTPVPLVASVLLATVAVVASGCLRPGELQRAIRLDVILLLGSLTSFSVALQKTGLADALATGLEQWLVGWPSYVVAMVLFIGTTLLTQVISNAASMALLAPVGAAGTKPGAAHRHADHGVVWASQSFLTPVGYQTNLMVCRPRPLRVPRCHPFGSGLTLIMTLLVPALVLWRYGPS